MLGLLEFMLRSAVMRTWWRMPSLVPERACTDGKKGRGWQTLNVLLRNRHLEPRALWEFELCADSSGHDDIFPAGSDCPHSWEKDASEHVCVYRCKCVPVHMPLAIPSAWNTLPTLPQTLQSLSVPDKILGRLPGSVQRFDVA